MIVLRDITGDIQNGHARFSQSEEEVPITMKSNADFSAVQQKLAAKKPFYKGISSVFKLVFFHLLEFNFFQLLLQVLNLFSTLMNYMLFVSNRFKV